MPACPECSGRVTAYAAGCEHCGADLDAWRRRGPVAVEEEPERSAAPAMPRPSGLAVALFAATLFAAVWISVLGLLLALFGLSHGFYERRPWTVVVYGALAILAIALEISRL